MKRIALFLVLATWVVAGNARKRNRIPLCYSVENTGAKYAAPVMPSFDALAVQRELPNPLSWVNGKGQVTRFRDWSRRRAEIGNLIQQYEIGEKPTVSRDQLEARMAGDTLVVDVHVGDSTLTLRSVIMYPSTERPSKGYPLLIGTSMISLPGELLATRPLAVMTYHEAQVNRYSHIWKVPGNTDRATYPFVHLYPHLIDNGAYSEWAWGLSRLIDGLQMLGPEVTGIDTEHIGVTGCSYAGKMALFCGAFDERVALTISQEPGGGGAAAWRTSHTIEGVEDLDHTDYHWFKESLRELFHDDNVYRLPYDHNQLCAMVFPRALLVLGNPDWKWLADESARQSMESARQVWDYFGVGDRVDVSIVGGHPHCQLPQSQYQLVGDYIDRFLLGK